MCTCRFMTIPKDFSVILLFVRLCGSFSIRQQASIRMQIRIQLSDKQYTVLYTLCITYTHICICFSFYIDARSERNIFVHIVCLLCFSLFQCVHVFVCMAVCKRWTPCVNCMLKCNKNYEFFVTNKWAIADIRRFMFALKTKSIPIETFTLNIRYVSIFSMYAHN